MHLGLPRFPALLARFLDGARAVWPGLWALMGDHPAGPAWAAVYTACYRSGRLLALRRPLGAGAAELLFLAGLAVLVPELTRRLTGPAAHVVTAAGLLMAGWGHAALAGALAAVGQPVSHLAGGLAGIAAVVLMPLSLGWPWLMVAAATGALAAGLLQPGTEPAPAGDAAAGAQAAGAQAAGAQAAGAQAEAEAPAAAAPPVRAYFRLVPLLFNTYYFCFATYLPLEFARRGSPLLAGLGFAIGWAPSLAWHWLAPLIRRWPPYRVVGGAALLLAPATWLIGLAASWWWLAAAFALQALLAGAVNQSARLARGREQGARLWSTAAGELAGPLLAGLLWSWTGGRFLVNAQVAAGLAVATAAAAWALAPTRWSPATALPRSA